MDLFEFEVESRIKIGSRYTSKLQEKGLNTTPFISPVTRVFMRNILFKSKIETLLLNMKNRGIPTSVHYPSLLPDQNALRSKKKNFLKNIFSKQTFKSYDLKFAQEIASKVISLPMHPYLSEDDQNLIIDSLMESIK